ncbi:M20/M25/M40 family metallo-hydrolase [Nonomuraea sp. NEAU-A123]|uniref:M20/M25/M40 family metallo-hydrolase n=1 Tax=Nonomuraea sp. NEAU-A123 TaxID=2839649 RepID=UPI001BE41AA3|nr:M20/M25/M40 family metallo-hydrolase [Nonomuraea sp. NEAU-A123]MBT2227097.1 M20/M25/M40 family metallo-hydrolase [Nonomuraea sp. NEAU-A123]
MTPVAAAEHASRRRSLAAGLMALCVLLLIAIGAIRDATPTAVSPASAPDREFSAQRAFAQVERFAVAPHPVGTAEHTRVRDYLVGELRRLGLRPEVHEAVGVSPIDEQGDPITAGRVFNIVTVIPGTAPTGRVFVTAHYDSVPEGPGANDDGAGTASAIETARALVADGTRLRNDVVFLITDAEEAGLLGSEAFVAGHPLAKGRSVVLNNEARGAKGPVLMFRSTEANSGLISMFGSAAPMPVADSVYAELMKLLNNDTDFTAFKPGGMAVLDSAYANAGTLYHSVLDDPAHVDLAALQQMGDNTLALVRAFGGTDLARLTTGNDLVYFNVPPGLLVRYPTWAATLLGAAALLAALALIFLARRRGLVTLRRTLLGTALALIPIGLAVGVGLSFWDLLKVIQPKFGGTATTTPYRPELFWLAVVMLAGTILVAWYALLRRRVGAAELALGMLTWAALIGLGLGIVSPGASHLAAWPALGAALGGLAALRCPPRWRVLILTAGLVPAALILLPSAWNTLPTGLQYVGYAPMPLVILFGGLLLPLIETVWPHRRSPLIPLTALVVSIALVAAGLLVEPIDKEHPRRTSLAYGLDADTGKAVWLTSKAPDQWARRYGGTNPTGQPPAELWGGSKLLSPAKAAKLPAPSLRVLADTTREGVRTLRVRIHSERGASAVGLRVDGDTATVSSLTVGGRSITADPAGFLFRAPGPEGVEVSLVVKGSGGKIGLRVTDVSPNPSEMSALPGFIAPPDWLFLGDTKISVTKLYAV